MECGYGVRRRLSPSSGEDAAQPGVCGVRRLDAARCAVEPAHSI